MDAEQERAKLEKRLLPFIKKDHLLLKTWKNNSGDEQSTQNCIAMSYRIEKLKEASRKKLLAAGYSVYEANSIIATAMKNCHLKALQENQQEVQKPSIRNQLRHHSCGGHVTQNIRNEKKEPTL